ncbi:MAG: hypothetical protein JSV84_18225, partial [Gemmatimonadota bacterium]
MNNKQITLLLLFTVLLVTIAAIAQNAYKYHGGSYDGFSMDASPPRYLGEGFDCGKYLGGSYDGFSMDASPPRYLGEG